MNIERLEASALEIANALRPASPACAIVLGSGWQLPLDRMDVLGRLSYARIPALGRTTVSGHPGEIILAQVSGRQVLLFCGRRHWYEGIGWDPIALPAFATRRLGVPILLLTCSAGGVAPDLAPGDVMQIRDHVNLMGTSPLIGPHDPFWGTRFPDQTAVYDKSLIETLVDCFGNTDLHHKPGVYAAVTGPTYETPAEVAALRTMGADAVGMSVVPEAMMASAAGLRVAGLALISNTAAGPHGTASHAEVLRVVASRVPQLLNTVLEFVRRLP